jgi:DNA invertase Pin-like site-specific DNA recombinase
MDMKIMNKLKDGGMSNRNSYRRRDSMGRYMDNGSYRRSYEDGFSGHDIRPKLQRMMEEADSNREREAIRMALQKL